jgi:hypothetical protein
MSASSRDGGDKENDDFNSHDIAGTHNYDGNNCESDDSLPSSPQSRPRSEPPIHASGRANPPSDSRDAANEGASIQLPLVPLLPPALPPLSPRSQRSESNHLPPLHDLNNNAAPRGRYDRSHLRKHDGATAAERHKQAVSKWYYRNKEKKKNADGRQPFAAAASSSSSSSSLSSSRVQPNEGNAGEDARLQRQLEKDEDLERRALAIRIERVAAGQPAGPNEPPRVPPTDEERRQQDETLRQYEQLINRRVQSIRYIHRTSGPADKERDHLIDKIGLLEQRIDNMVTAHAEIVRQLREVTAVNKTSVEKKDSEIEALRKQLGEPSFTQRKPGNAAERKYDFGSISPDYDDGGAFIPPNDDDGDVVDMTNARHEPVPAPAAAPAAAAAAAAATTAATAPAAAPARMPPAPPTVASVAVVSRPRSAPINNDHPSPARRKIPKKNPRKRQLDFAGASDDDDGDDVGESDASKGAPIPKKRMPLPLPPLTENDHEMARIEAEEEFKHPPTEADLLMKKEDARLTHAQKRRERKEFYASTTHLAEDERKLKIQEYADKSRLEGRVASRHNLLVINQLKNIKSQRQRGSRSHSSNSNHIRVPPRLSTVPEDSVPVAATKPTAVRPASTTDKDGDTNMVSPKPAARRRKSMYLEPMESPCVRRTPCPSNNEDAANVLIAAGLKSPINVEPSASPVARSPRPPSPPKSSRSVMPPFRRSFTSPAILCHDITEQQEEKQSPSPASSASKRIPSNRSAFLSPPHSDVT